MPVFRSTARRRPLRAPARRRTSTRWAPPGFSPAAGVTIDLATFYDPFDETTLATWWVDTAVTTPGPTVDSVVTAGAGLLFAPAATKHTEVRGRYPFNFAGNSVTFDISIPAATFTDTSSFIQVALIPNSGPGIVAGFTLQFVGAVWEVEIAFDYPVDLVTYTTTTGAEWRFIRFSSNTTTPLDVAAYRSPDGRVWTQVGSYTFANLNQIASLRLYAWGSGA